MPPTLLIAGTLKAPDVLQGELPIEYIQRWLKKRMIEYGGHGAELKDRIIIVRSETGSGKSTVLPVNIFRILRNKNTSLGEKYRGASVICTQPKVLTAVALANDVSSERLIDGVKVRLNPDMIMKTTVGYQTGPITERPICGLIYATAGVLAVQLRNQDDIDIMMKYKFIIVDEAHERSLDSDFMLMLLKNFYERNVGDTRLPFLILTSATFDVKRYAEYFGVPDNIIEVTGRSFGINIHWLEKSVNNYLKEAITLIQKIHEENLNDVPEKADILMFVPGAMESKEIESGMQQINKQYTRNIRPMLIVVINSESIASQSNDFKLIFEKMDKLPLVNNVKPLRRLIISTTVAETGLTIDTLKYVLDGGWNRSKETYQPFGARGLVTRPAPQSRIEQRKGRVGRLFTGEFYPLYTKETFNLLDKQQLPDIISNGIEDVFLPIVKEQQKQKIRRNITSEFLIADMNMLEPPSVETFLMVNTVATTLGFLSPCSYLPRSWPPEDNKIKLGTEKYGYGLTEIGFIASMFGRTSMEGIRILLMGYIENVSMQDLITMVSMIGTSFEDLFTNQEKKSKSMGNKLLMLSDEEKILISDDFIEIILIFNKIMKKISSSQGELRDITKWFKDNGLKFDNIIEVLKKRDSIIEEMISVGLNPFKNEEQNLHTCDIDKIIQIKQCLYNGFRNKLLIFDKKDYCYKTNLGLKVKVSQTINNMQNKPKYILTDQIILTSSNKQNPDKQMLLQYVAKCNLISILDGYIGIDESFNDFRYIEA